MVPQIAYWPVLLLAAMATVIASQAVITGAFSVTQQAVSLGLLPRIDIRRTSETQAGQIYVPQVNTLLLIGVLVLLFSFKGETILGNPLTILWIAIPLFIQTMLIFWLALQARLRAGAVPDEASVIEALTDMPFET
jgi:KUP system potassium uptake protein